MFFARRTSRLWIGLIGGALLCACAPPPMRPARRAQQTAPPPPAIEPREENKKPILSESEIREQNLPGGRGALPSGLESPEAPLHELPMVSPQAKLEGPKMPDADREVAPVRPEATSLLAMITPQTSPRSALSLRLTEEGEKLLGRQEYRRALARLEKAISMDSRNGYAYYYLAQAHYALERFQQSLSFLDIAQSYFADRPLWLAAVVAWQGKNFAALGFLHRADESYARALSLDPENRVALEELTAIGHTAPAAAR